MLRSVNYDNVVYESRLVVKMLCSAKYKIQVFDLFFTGVSCITEVAINDSEYFCQVRGGPCN